MLNDALQSDFHQKATQLVAELLVPSAGDGDPAPFNDRLTEIANTIKLLTLAVKEARRRLPEKPWD